MLIYKQVCGLDVNALILKPQRRSILRSAVSQSSVERTDERQGTAVSCIPQRLVLNVS